MFREQIHKCQKPNVCLGRIRPARPPPFAFFNGFPEKNDTSPRKLTCRELMTAVNPYCSKCGSPLESDCDFCPACGAAKSNLSQAVSPATREAHSWMQDPVVSAGSTNSGRLAQQSPPPQIQYVPYAVPAPAPATVIEEGGLPIAVRTMGIIALCLMVVALIPCLGWLNYFNFLVSPVTFVLAIVAIVGARTDSGRTSAILGLVLVLIANMIGVGRLILGGGCL